MSDASFTAFNQLKNKIKNFNEFANGNRTFQAMVIYTYKKKRHEELLRIVLQLTTEEGGTIDLYDGNHINAEDLHTQFSARWQNYSYSPEGFFTIKGTGKIGNYEVKIIPV